VHGEFPRARSDAQCAIILTRSDNALMGESPPSAAKAAATLRARTSEKTNGGGQLHEYILTRTQRHCAQRSPSATLSYVGDELTSRAA